MELTRRDLLKEQRRRLLVRDVRAPSIFVRRLTQASAQDNTIKVGILHSLSGDRDHRTVVTQRELLAMRRSTPRRVSRQEDRTDRCVTTFDDRDRPAQECRMPP